jgi:hypothetical protein
MAIAEYRYRIQLANYNLKKQRWGLRPQLRLLKQSDVYYDREVCSKDCTKALHNAKQQWDMDMRPQGIITEYPLAETFGVSEKIVQTIFDRVGGDMDATISMLEKLPSLAIRLKCMQRSHNTEDI